MPSQNKTNKKKKISFIIPVYSEEIILEKSIQKILEYKKILNRYTVEFIFIDDGSRDQSWNILEKYARKNTNRITAVKLMKNVGSWDAIHAGFEVCSGDAAILISADLQEPVDSIIEIIKAWNEQIKAVYGIRKSRNDPLLQKGLARIYYALFRLFAIKDYPIGGFDFCLLDRVVFEKVLEINERNTHMQALIFSLGYPFAYVPYTRESRLGGRSKWSLKKRLKLAIDSFVAFSYTPIRIIAWIGILYSLLSISYGIVIIIAKIFHDKAPAGWSALAILTSFTSGVQMLMLSIIGEYLWRILDTVRSRPRYIIDKVFKK